MNELMLPPSWRNRAMVVSAPDDEPLDHWFTAEEIRERPPFKFAARARQWMLSRVVAKRLAVTLGYESDPLTCRIERRRLRGLHLSFSHSGNYAAAAIGRTPVGIDVEVQRTINPRAAHLFLSESEEEAAASCRITDALLHFWCAKEAAWKREEGAIATLKRVPLVVQLEAQNGIRFEGVETLAIGNVVLALTE